MSVVQPETALELVRQVVTDSFIDYESSDQISVQFFPSEILIEYLPQALQSDGVQKANSVDCTQLVLSCYPSSRIAWLSQLKVAAPFQGTGRGRALALLASDLAVAFDCTIIRIRPLCRAFGFWERIGYQPEPGTSQIMYKSCADTRGSVDPPQ